MCAASSDKLVVDRRSTKPEDFPLVGLKATGLVELPRSWVPDFFVITNKLSDRWNKRYSKGKGNIVRCKDILTGSEVKLIADALEGLNVPIGGSVIVRSSSPREGIELRGTFLSKESEPTVEAILETCDTIFQHASSNRVSENIGTLDLALIVQIYIEHKASGHLSNERRVAKRRQEWTYDFDFRENKPPVGRFALKYGKSRTISADTSELVASGDKELISRLRSVAAYINNKGLRLHMEWVWDGHKLWVVQGDKDLEHRGRNPKSYFPKVKPFNIPTLKSLIHASSVSHNHWHKIECLRDFKAAGLIPAEDLWVLEDTSILSSLQKGDVRKELEEDIKALISIRPIVIRTDIKSSVGLPKEMLRRSDSIATFRSAKKFLIRESRNMRLKGVAPSDFCFIVHHYIPSRSSAFCLAYPNRKKVRIDAIWGLPDGLMFYPHDSFELNPDDVVSMKKHMRFKSDYLAPSQAGNWIPVKSGKPWDWMSSMREDELVNIGKHSKKLASHINNCVQVMWFVDIPSELGLPQLLPWWYEVGEPPLGADEADPRVFTRNRIIISTREDLKRLPSKGPEGFQDIVLRLKPKPKLLRDDDFLKRVADKAVKYNIPVELEGSILQHAYYRLKKLSVRIQCVDFFKPSFQAQQFGKLVRDRIPLRIQKGGEIVYAKLITEEDLVRLLKAKAVEEALELVSAMTPDDMKEELGDILEVILTLADRIDMSKRELYEKVNQKGSERGGFGEGILLIETKDVPLIDIERGAYQLRGQWGKPWLRLSDEEAGPSPMSTQRVPKKQNGVIRMPLVPPDLRDHDLKIEDLGVVLRIRYDDKEVVIRWAREAPKVPKVPKEQRRLF